MGFTTFSLDPRNTYRLVTVSDFEPLMLVFCQPLLAHCWGYFAGIAVLPSCSSL